MKKIDPPTIGHGKYVNGKGQIVDLLRKMSPFDKKRLLGNINKRNPQMAQELSEQGIGMNNLELLSDSQLHELSFHVSPEVLGMALKNSNIDFQRRILKLIPREKAIVAYQIITDGPIKDEWSHCHKAQMKILQIVMPMFGRSSLGLI